MRYIGMFLAMVGFTYLLTIFLTGKALGYQWGNSVKGLFVFAIIMEAIVAASKLSFDNLDRNQKK